MFRGLTARFRGPWPAGPCLWLHGASLGEARMLLGVVRMLAERSFFSGSCLLTVQKAEIVEYLRSVAPVNCAVALAPLDVSAVSRLFWERVRPWALVLGEAELWPGWLRQARRRAVPVALVSGRIRCLFPWLSLDALYFASMQSEADCVVLNEAGRQRLNCVPFVGGDWKNLGHVQAEPDAASRPRQFSLALLSVHRQEWPFLQRMIRCGQESGLRMVLVPRRLEELSFFREKLAKIGCACVKWPQVASAGGISLVEGFGSVGHVAASSHVAFVGGSFCSTGVHDFWEPLRAGCAVWIGPVRKPHAFLLKKMERQGVVRFLSRRDPVPDFQWDDPDGRARFLSDCDGDVRRSFERFGSWLQGVWQVTFGA